MLNLWQKSLLQQLAMLILLVLSVLQALCLSCPDINLLLTTDSHRGCMADLLLCCSRICPPRHQAASLTQHRRVLQISAHRYVIDWHDYKTAALQ